eukprot:CAMPEP_0168608912 /NCGR_PEP_ID=MMETSP0449_2-20121227/906_1 /TAXON_ID=1082188 /ORGANISM="Strombidium rassoulzadegani, Strain ras09" /LENGTH=100 /DNA_ID=CAMNT_0008648981 /DNA_START=44 /DNA_END=346 /DNA_ORIENTATION=+
MPELLQLRASLPEVDHVPALTILSSRGLSRGNGWVVERGGASAFLEQIMVSELYIGDYLVPDDGQSLNELLPHALPHWQLELDGLEGVGHAPRREQNIED